MNLFRHQFLTDLRTHRIVLAISLTAALLFPFAGIRIALALSSELGEATMVVLGVLTLLAALMTSGAALSSSSFTGSSTFWRTRPISQATMFRVRSLWLLLLVMLPLGLGIALSVQPLHLSASQSTTVVLTIAGGAIALLTLGTALRATVEGNWQFRMHIAVSACLFFGSALLMSVFLHFSGLRPHSERMVSGMQVAIAVTLMLGIAAWVLVARFRRARAAMASCYFALAAIPWILMLWNLPSPGRTSSLPYRSLVMTLVEPREVSSHTQPNGLVVWKNLQVKGLEANQLFVPVQTAAGWTPPESSMSQSLEVPGNANPFLFRRISEVLPASAIWDRIKNDYSAKTTWRIPEGPHHHSHQQLHVSNKSGIGTLTLQVEGVVTELNRGVTLDLQDGARSAIRGGGVASLHNPELKEHKLRFSLQMLRPSSFLKPEWRTEEVRSRNPHFSRDGNLWAVLHHPPSGSAIGIGENNGSRTGQFGPSPLIDESNVRFEVALPRLQLMMLGVDPESWLEEAELHVYSLTPVGRAKSGKLERRGYHANGHHRDDTETGNQGLKNVSLPKDPSSAEIETFLDATIYGPGNTHYLQRWKGLPQEALVALANRLPLPQNPDHRARELLESRANEIPDDVALNGLRRDVLFVKLCMKKGLGAEAAEILRPRLREHRPLPDGAILGIIKTVLSHSPLDADLKTDLHWHFVHPGSSTRSIASILYDLEGFDFESAVTEAWRNQRTGSSNYDITGLAPYALFLGDREALRLTLRRLQGEKQERERKPILQLLTAHLATNLPPEDAFHWTVENFTELEFDRVSRKYGLPGKD